MKRVAKKTRKFFKKYGEDFGYLALVGLPNGLFFILLSKAVELGEVY